MQIIYQKEGFDSMSETRKLYYEDVYKKEFTAKVLECRECEKGFEIILDQSAFYPEGGGQPCDLGTLNGIAVLDVQEKDREIVHYTKEAVEAGSEVIGKIDWDRRFDLMQQHSGEHIVSGLVHEAYGYDNVGFHMSSDVITVDLSGVLTEAQLAEIEAETNQKIWENSEVEITYPSKKNWRNSFPRSKKELTGQVASVRLPGSDLCACCGTHIRIQEKSERVKIAHQSKNFCRISA
ncbi:MAG: alanyl-tRNA editing protein [Lachnospiraceae bacterium]